MKILLLRPASPNERFGLGPFFRVEPLGLEYVAACLLRQGHEVQIQDLRFHRSIHKQLERFRPSIVGISCLHTVDVPSTLETARAVKRWNRSALVVVGGHAAAAYPQALFDGCVDAISMASGESTVTGLANALEKGIRLEEVPGLWLPKEGKPERTQEGDASISINDLLPARHLIRPYQSRYLCVHKSPLWAVETARGCPYRCSFCSVWKLHERRFRCRDIDLVCRDMASVGKNVFVVDDLFWHPRERSLALAKELLRRGIRKDWMLVQARVDTVAKNEELLRAWRPVSRQFDIFFGFEAPRNEQLEALSKDATVEATEAGVGVARSLSYGVTGNFVVDPAWGEAEFESMWAMVDRLGLNRSGFTVLTPLPGTELFDSMRERIEERDWSRWDMHHLLVEPRLGRRRFFELFVESWKRNVLSPRYSTQKWWRWARELGPRQLITFLQVIVQTQRMLRVEAYMKETIASQTPAATAPFSD